jgi:hypothetical protein
MTLEHLNEQKMKYQHKAEYFQNIGFEHLTADFQGVVDLISEIENYIKEKENGKEV